MLENNAIFWQFPTLHHSVWDETVMMSEKVLHSKMGPIHEAHSPHSCVWLQGTGLVRTVPHNSPAPYFCSFEMSQKKLVSLFSVFVSDLPADRNLTNTYSSVDLAPFLCTDLCVKSRQSLFEMLDLYLLYNRWFIGAKKSKSRDYMREKKRDIVLYMLAVRQHIGLKCPVVLRVGLSAWLCVCLCVSNRVMQPCWLVFVCYLCLCLKELPAHWTGTMFLPLALSLLCLCLSFLSLFLSL